jgi:hypothetical protein
MRHVARSDKPLPEAITMQPEFASSFQSLASSLLLAALDRVKFTDNPNKRVSRRSERRNVSRAERRPWAMDISAWPIQ